MSNKRSICGRRLARGRHQILTGLRGFAQVDADDPAGPGSCVRSGDQLTGFGHWGVGRHLKEQRSWNWNKPLVVVVADHGEAIEDGSVDHGSDLTVAQIHVPFCHLGTKRLEVLAHDLMQGAMLGLTRAIAERGRHAENQNDTVRLFRVSLSGGAEVEIPVHGDYRVSPDLSLAPNAVGPDGRIVVRIVSRDSWFWPPGVLDQKTGVLTPVLKEWNVDYTMPGWGVDGNIVGIVWKAKSRLWRFRPVR